MCKRALILIFSFFLALSPMTFAQAPAQKPPEEPPPVLSVPKDYRYNGKGRRDPFVNPIPKPVQRQQAAAGGAVPVAPQCQQGLKGVLVAQATISGVVTSREPSMNVAVIAAPGNKTYFARVGDALCDALVKSIKLDAVTFVVIPTEGSDPKIPPREIERKLRPTSGDNK